MNLRTIVAGLAGGIAYWAGGFIFYVVLLSKYFGQNHGAGVKEPYDMWAIIVGCLIFGLLLAFIFDRWANISRFDSGAIAGGIIGLFTGLSTNFVRYGDSTFFTSLTPGIVDALVQAGMATMGGAVAGFVLGKMKKSQ